MIHLKSQEEIELIKISGDLLGRAHGEVAKNVKEGVTTLFLDKIAEEYIRDHQGIPSFKGYSGFPGTLCVSPNEQVVHGMPNDSELKNGDIISIDCGVFLNGFHSDSAYTYGIGDVTDDVKDLLDSTLKSLYQGIDSAQSGNRTGDIGYSIQNFVEKKGYSVVRELVGHGVGRNLHEAPEVPNYGKRGRGAKLKPGMVIAIEPMINLGKRQIVQESDGWTIRTSDKKASAHFEHTIAITQDGPEILTTFKYIEQVLNNG